MATITEDYVSFETAKLLKEKGFDVPCNCYGAYNGVNLIYRLCITDKYTNWNKHTDKLIISCPTLQMAMKWLREVHNIHIDIDPDWASKGGFAVIGYCFNIHSIVNPWYEDLVTYPTYEQAVEAAIKYCLENLI